METTITQPLMMNLTQIQLDRLSLRQFCVKYGIGRLSLFGSILREDFGPGSDVDFLVEFLPGRVPGLLGLAAMELELTGMVGRKADLRTVKELSQYFRQAVLAEAVVQYGED